MRQPVLSESSQRPKMDQVIAAESRFWAKVNKSGPVPAHQPDLGACWVWTGGTNRKHYGQINIAGVICRANRVAWTMAEGFVPDGMFVLHACDNPRCVRRSHLFLGTHVANMADEVAKGRQARGERNSGAKLTPDQVVAARASVLAGASLKQIARDLSISSHEASSMVGGVTWKHLPGALSEDFRATRAARGEKHSQARLTEADVRAIREIAASGVPHRQIADDFRVSQSHVSLVVRRTLWRHVA
jgi:hypothetical protein